MCISTAQARRLPQSVRPDLGSFACDQGLWTVDFTCRGRPNFQCSSHSPWFTSLLDSVGLFVEMYPKAKHLDCFSTWVLQTWQARLMQRGSKPHWRCIHVEAGIACNRRDWMECYATNVFYVALACKLTHQILKTTCIYNIYIYGCESK